jgi:hypothetical protein
VVRHAGLTHIAHTVYMYVRVRVKIMGLTRIRTDGDLATILHFCDPVISTRTRMYAVCM